MADRIALVVTDIDGTLITSNHEITEATRRAAALLAQSGIALSLASSRPPGSILPLAEALDVSAPIAAFNGAIILSTDGGLLERSTISVETTAGIKQIADELGIGVWLYDETDWWAPARNPFVDREQHTSGLEPLIDGYERRLQHEVNKLTVVGDPKLVAIAEERVNATLSQEVSASRSKPRFLDVTAYGTHKGSAVQRLAKQVGVDLERVAVIGDGPNDVQMFEVAGTSIAMGQAVEEVILAARYLTNSNDDEGWSRAMRMFVLAAHVTN